MSFQLIGDKSLICWGIDDTATPFSSAEKINNLINDSSLITYEGDHYFFLNYAKDVAQNI